MDSRILSPEGARAAGTDKPWEGTNEQWWDWYLSLAEGADATPTELTEVPPPADVEPISLGDLEAQLAEPYALADADRERFAAEGYVKLPAVLSPEALALARAEVDRVAAAGPGAGASGFLSMDQLWQGDSAVLRLFALSPRLGRLAADLLGVADTRLYHDNVLSKAGGVGRTPWHFDAHHFPIASRDVVTSWIPVQDIPAVMGPLAFAVGMDAWRSAEAVDFATAGDSYDRGVSEAFRRDGVAVDDTPYALGDVSFHHSWCFHSARGNASTQPRTVVSNTYFADGARLVDEVTMVSGDWRRFIPDTGPGEPITGPLSPVVS